MPIKPLHCTRALGALIEVKLAVTQDFHEIAFRTA